MPTLIVVYVYIMTVSSLLWLGVFVALLVGGDLKTRKGFHLILSMLLGILVWPLTLVGGVLWFIVTVILTYFSLPKE